MKPSLPEVRIIDQYPVNFHHDELIVYKGDDGFTYFSFDAICTKLQINLDDELNIISQRSSILAGMYYHRRLNQDNNEEIILMFRVNHFALWLAAFPAGRIKSEALRAHILDYQNKFAQLLE